MAKIDNEIVKFIAEVELDPQTAAEYTKGLQEAEKHNAALRKSISETVQQMDQLRAAGKENSAEFQKHKASLEADTRALKESSKQAEKYSSALGIQSMNFNQLQKHAKQVRAALNSVHKEANPQLWEKYNKELIATQKRMAELKGGASQTKGILGGMFKKVIPTFDVVSLGLKALNGAVKLGKKAWEDFKQETQKWGDTIQIEMAAADAVWHHFIRNMSAGRGEITLTYNEVANLAREAAKLKDEIFELTNSYNIMEAEAKPKMQELEAVFRDTSKPIEERKAALEEMKALELKLAEDRLVIAKQAEDAAYDDFRRMTALDREAAESFISNYLEAKKSGLTEEAELYGQMINRLEYLNGVVAEGHFFSRKTYQAIYDEQEQLRGKIAQTSEEVKRFYRELSQYNLGNDAATSAYANAVAGRLQAQAAADPSAVNARYARMNGTLNGGGRGRSSRQSRKDREYQERIKAAEDAYKQEQLALKEALLRREITEQEYNARILTAEMVMYQNKIAIAKNYGKDTLAFENSLADKRLEIERRIRTMLEKDDAEFQRMMEASEKETEEVMDQLMKEIEASIEAELDELPDPIKRLSELAEKAMKDEMKSRNGKLAVVRQEQETELAALEEMHDYMLLSEEEYLARKKALNKETARQIAEINLETWTTSFEIANQFLDQASQLVDSIREAELQNLEAQKQKELTLAGDNADERQRIEEEYEAKKLETEKKYADADMAINIAKTIAEGAVAAMKAFADLGPIAGAVMAGLLAATTVAQVAVIVAQRNAIKNASSASSSSAGAGASDVVGFSDGGYTGKGGRLEPAGIVHRGEYVVAAPELRDPYVAAQVAGIERLRLARTGGRSRLPGFADGGYTDGSAAALQTPEIERKLENITEVLLEIYDNPIPAYMLSSQWEAEQIRIDRHRKYSSLRRKNK